MLFLPRSHFGLNKSYDFFFGNSCKHTQFQLSSFETSTLLTGNVILMSIEIERISTVEQFQQINILNHLIGFVLYEHIFCLNRKKNIINSLNAFENDWPQNLKNSHNLFLNLTAKHNEYVEGYIDDEWTQEAENCAFFGFDILEWTFHEESSYKNIRIIVHWLVTSENCSLFWIASKLNADPTSP